MPDIMSLYCDCKDGVKDLVASLGICVPSGLVGTESNLGGMIGRDWGYSFFFLMALRRCFQVRCRCCVVCAIVSGTCSSRLKPSISNAKAILTLTRVRIFVCECSFGVVAVQTSKQFSFNYVSSATTTRMPDANGVVCVTTRSRREVNIYDPIVIS